MRRLIIAIACWLLLCGRNDVLHAQRFTFEALTGSAYNVPTPLTVSQDGYPDLQITAHYDTKPFGPFYPYYSWRASLWNKEGTAAWEVTQVHHRLFLNNPPPEIQTFEVHFGYNFYMVGRAWRRGKFIYHIDGGVLICNPTNTVRGLTLNTHGAGIFDQGYYLSGGGGQFGVSRNFQIARHVSIVGNGSVMAGRARLPVVNGSSTVPNVSVHGQLGAGFNF